MLFSVLILRYALLKSYERRATVHHNKKGRSPFHKSSALCPIKNMNIIIHPTLSCNTLNQISYDEAIAALKKNRYILQKCYPGKRVIFYGHYTRSIMTENGLVPLHIQRIAIIHDDGSMNTHALLPEQIIPYSRFILPVIFQLIKAFRLSELHRPLADQTIDQLASQYSMFQETIYRLKRRYTIIWEPVLDQIHHWHENSWLDISKKILNNCHKQLMQATKRSICAFFSIPT